MALRAKANVPAFQSDHHDINTFDCDHGDINAFQSDHHDINAFDCDHHDYVEANDDGNFVSLVLTLHLPESLKTILSYVLWRCRGFPHA